MKGTARAPPHPQPLAIHECRYLIFSGGAMRGAAGMIGVLFALHDVLAAMRDPSESGHRFSLRDHFTGGYAGASIGAVIAAMVAMGLSCEEVIERTLEVDFRSMMSTASLARLCTQSGIVDRTAMTRVWEKTLEDKGFPRGVTLAQFERRTKRRMQIAVTHMNASPCPESVYLSGSTHPEVKLIDALKMSTALPLMFVPERCEAVGRGSDAVFVDGGMLDNFPVAASFGRNALDRGQCLGFYMPREDFSKLDMANPLVFAKSIVYTASNVRQHEQMRTVPPERAGNIFEVPDNDLKLTNFDVRPSRFREIVERTRAEMRHAIRTRILLWRYMNMLAAAPVHAPSDPAPTEAFTDE